MNQNLQINSYLSGALLCLAAGMLCLQGCKKAEQGQNANSAVSSNATATPKPPVKPVLKQISSSVKFFTPSSNQFDFSSKRDPFKPYAVFKKPALLPQKGLKRMDRSFLPIHSFDVSQFRMIGVVTGGKDSQAMVVDPSGKGYVLKVGMTIGKNDGRVVSISSGGVDVLEQFRDDNGKLRKEHIKISMPRKL